MAGPNRNTNSSAVMMRAAGAEGDVAKDVQRPDLVAEAHQRIEHPSPSWPPRSEARQHGLDQRRHARPQRALDHYHVARLHGHPSNAGSSSAEEGAHRPLPLPVQARRTGAASSAPQARTRSTPAASTASFSPRCSRGDSSPSSSISPRTATRRAKRSRGVTAMARQRSAHRGRIGVVALVDQQDLAIRRVEQRARAPAGGRGDARKSRQAAHGSRRRQPRAWPARPASFARSARQARRPGKGNAATRARR